MHWTARVVNRYLCANIIDHHPRLLIVRQVCNRTEKFSMEGGDELILSDKVMAIGGPGANNC